MDTPTSRSRLAFEPVLSGLPEAFKPFGPLEVFEPVTSGSSQKPVLFGHQAGPVRPFRDHRGGVCGRPGNPPGNFWGGAILVCSSRSGTSTPGHQAGEAHPCSSSLESYIPCSSPRGSDIMARLAVLCSSTPTSRPRQPFPAPCLWALTSRPG